MIYFQYDDIDVCPSWQKMLYYYNADKITKCCTRIDGVSADFNLYFVPDVNWSVELAKVVIYNKDEKYKKDII